MKDDNDRLRESGPAGLDPCEGLASVLDACGKDQGRASQARGNALSASILPIDEARLQAEVHRELLERVETAALDGSDNDSIFVRSAGLSATQRLGVVNALASRLSVDVERKADLEERMELLALAPSGGLVALRDIHPQVVESIIVGLIRAGSRVCVHGPPGSGKTAMLVHLVMCLTLGEQWHGRRVKPCAVLYIALEGQRAEVENRFAAAKLFLNIGNIDLPLFLWTEPWRPFDRPEEVERMRHVLDLSYRYFRRRIPDFEKFELLIIIDTLAKALRPGSDRDDADVETLLSLIGELQKHAAATWGKRATAILVHHERVDAPKNGPADPRGAGNLKGDVDTSIRVVSVGRTPEGGTISNVLAGKQREATRRDDAFASFHTETVTFDGLLDSFGEPVVSMVAVPDDLPMVSTAERKKPPAAESRVLDQLRQAIDSDYGQWFQRDGGPRQGITRSSFKQWRTERELDIGRASQAHLQTLIGAGRVMEEKAGKSQDARLFIGQGAGCG